MRKSLNIVLAVGWATYKEWAAFRSHMAVSILIGPIYFLVQYFIWGAVFSSRDVLNGFTLTQMLAYYGIMSCINYLTFDFADWNLQMLIRTGKYVTFALRPVSHVFFAFSQKVGHRSLGLWMEFLPVFLIYMLVFRIDLMPSYPFWAILSVGLGFVMTFLVNYCIGISAFWLTNADGLRGMFHLLRNISAGILIPLTFFPEAIQNVLFFLPFQFMQYVPARVWIGHYELAGYALSIPQVVGLQAIAVLLMAGAASLLIRIGNRRFTGVGV